MPTLAELDQRYTQQAGWTSSIRQSLLSQVDLEHCQTVLEVGCGTGAVLDTLPRPPQFHVGIDLDLPTLRFAREKHPALLLAAADALRLPFASASFEITFCHFFLLWVTQPLAALAEMRRITRPGGWVIAFAEPDHAHRLDFPTGLEEIGRRQTQALQQQGADPRAGRKLRGWFAQTGLEQVYCGLLGGEWQSGGTLPPGWEQEWSTLRSDLAAEVPAAERDHWQQLDRQAWLSGERVLYVPTFFAIGRKPENEEHENS